LAFALGPRARAAALFAFAIDADLRELSIFRTKPCSTPYLRSLQLLINYPPELLAAPARTIARDGIELIGAAGGVGPCARADARGNDDDGIIARLWPVDQMVE